MTEQILAIAASYGPAGLMIAYFVWREEKRDRRDEKRTERIEQILSDNAEADKETAKALTLLAERIHVRAL